MHDDHEEPLVSTLKRRKFLKAGSLLGAGVAGAVLLAEVGCGTAGFPGATAHAQGGPGTGGTSGSAGDPAAPGSPVSVNTNDMNLLNFALNLEYLEAEFYTVATTGNTISQIGIGVDGVGKQGPTEGGQQVNFGNPAYAAVAQQIAADEQTHVKLLRTLLGSNAIAKPTINLAALGAVTNLTQFLALARAFEDVGVSAYGAAAPLIQANQVLAIAARIALTEGEHTGNLRLLVALNNVSTMKLDAQDILSPPSGTQYFSTTAGLTTLRTPSEVLAIVYANKAPGTDMGGFFPDGANGAITAVA